MIKKFGAVMLALVAAGCASPFKSAYDAPNGKALVINQAEWVGFQTYLSLIGSTRPGAFTLHVTDGHTDDYHYSLCEYDSCMGGPAYPNAAMNICLRDGGECVLFASNREILLNYKRADQ
jgi:hypothetical protein